MSLRGSVPALIVLLVAMTWQDVQCQVIPGQIPDGATIDAQFTVGVKQGWRGAAADLNCDLEGDYRDFFMIAQEWYSYHECQCVHDADHDGLTNCEEFVLRTDPEDRDTDDDCLSDGLELALGLDPLDSDSDDNEVPDGADDNDGNGFIDGEEDFDLDNIPNCQETSQECCDPTGDDTDGDGWPDGAELDAGTDPCDELSQPWAIYSTVRVSVLLPSVADRPGGAVVASPGVRVFKPELEPEALNTTVSQAVRVMHPSLDLSELNTVASPSEVRVIKPHLDADSRNTTVAAPPVVVSTTGQ